MSSIVDVLHSDYKFLQDEGYEIFGIFLVGSQNYRLDTSGSDIDRKAIVLPSVDCLIFHKGNIEKTYHRPDGGELCVKDINSMIQNIFKQNMNFVELLFTEHFVLNPKYAAEYNWIEQHRERIAHYSEYLTAKCMQGIVHNQYHKLFNSLPSNSERITKYGYDGKALSNIYRSGDFLHRYLKGTIYQHAIVPKNRKLLIAYKTYDVVLNSTDLHESITEWISCFDSFIDALKQTSPDYEIRKETEEWMKTVICDYLRGEIE